LLVLTSCRIARNSSSQVEVGDDVVPILDHAPGQVDFVRVGCGVDETPTVEHKGQLRCMAHLPFALVRPVDGVIGRRIQKLIQISPCSIPVPSKKKKKNTHRVLVVLMRFGEM
jgi:hypothetical protein